MKFDAEIFKVSGLIHTKYICEECILKVKSGDTYYLITKINLSTGIFCYECGSKIIREQTRELFKNLEVRKSINKISKYKMIETK